jgi:hypothetical protein
MSQRRGEEAFRRLHTVGDGGAGTTAGCFNAACESVIQCAETVAFKQVKKKRQPARRGETHHDGVGCSARASLRLLSSQTQDGSMMQLELQGNAPARICSI